MVAVHGKVVKFTPKSNKSVLVFGGKKFLAVENNGNQINILCKHII